VFNIFSLLTLKIYFIWEAVFADMGVALIAIANATMVVRSDRPFCLWGIVNR
jgi:hypothetical protein